MLSRRFHTIFVHIPKTAGQSVERVFLANHNLDWPDRGELLLRHNPDPQLGPERLAHLYAREYLGCGYVTPQEFSAFRKFAVVRNPYARALSEFRYRFPKQPVTAIERFLQISYENEFEDRARHMAPQIEFIRSETDRPLVETIFRFETDLNDRLGEFLQDIFGAPQPLPHANASHGRSARISDLSDKARTLIFRKYECDFDAFQYPRHAGVT